MYEKHKIRPRAAVWHGTVQLPLWAPSPPVNCPAGGMVTILCPQETVACREKWRLNCDCAVLWSLPLPSLTEGEKFPSPLVGAGSLPDTKAELPAGCWPVPGLSLRPCSPLSSTHWGLRRILPTPLLSHTVDKAGNQRTLLFPFKPIHSVAKFDFPLVPRPGWLMVWWPGMLRATYSGSERWSSQSGRSAELLCKSSCSLVNGS